MIATHRTTRILNHLAAHPGGCTNAEIVAVVHRTEPDVKPVLIGTLAHYLVRAGKLTTTGSYGTRRFFPVPEAPIDRRVRATDDAARTPAKAGKKAKLAALEKALRIGGIAVYSILRDWVKGQVTAIEIGMLSFEAAFLAHLMLPSGLSVIEHVEKQKLLQAPASDAVA